MRGISTLLLLKRVQDQLDTARDPDGDQKNTAAPNSGAVYVFTHDGNTLGVGTYDEEGGKGAVYAFARKNGKWMQESRMQGSNAERGDSLGCSLAISGDGNTIVSGAFDEDSILAGVIAPDAGANDEPSDTSTGIAYVFVRKDRKWSQEAAVKAFNTRLNDQFGWALAMSRDGNTMAIFRSSVRVHARHSVEI